MKKVNGICTSLILFVCSTAFMMDDAPLDTITQKLEQYFDRFPAEKLYLHFSEDVWVAGEKVWCKAYLLKGSNLQPATESKVLYAQLRNRQGNIVQALTLHTSNGIAKGSFVLPDSLSGGWYQIYAYTQWMLNFQEESHYTRPVFIVNPLQEKPQNSVQPVIPDGDTVRDPLPAMQPKQVSMEIGPQASGVLQADIHKLDENFRARDLYLVAVSGERVVHTESFKFRADQFSIELPYSLFKQGIAHIALFDEAMVVLDARDVVIPYASGMHVEIATDQASYAPREKGQFTVSLSDQQGNPLAAHASVSIRKMNALSVGMHINHALESGSEREGISQTRNAFDWTHIVHESIPAIHFPKETEGITIRGKLLKTDGEPLAQERVVLSVAGPETWFQYDYTREDGSFHLLIERVFGAKDVVIQAPEVDEPYQIVLEEDKQQVQQATLQLLPTLDEQALEDFFQQCRQRVKIHDMYTFYRQEDIADDTPQKKRQAAPFRFYGVPNVELYLEDYIALPNMEEVCRELLPGVQLRIEGDTYDFNVFDVRTRTFLPDEPALFVDGVLVFDKGQVVNFPPENIEKIETINRRTFYGDFPFNGVVSIFTLAGNQYESMLPRAALQTTLSFYDRPESFPMVNEKELDSRIPDLRTLLYWNPDVKFDESGNVTLAYVHSDETGTFEVVVEGITTEGQPFSKTMQYEVVFQ